MVDLDPRENGRKKKAISRPILLSMAIGTILNPLNSSMISVALVVLAFDFDVSTTHITLVISAFYLTAAVGQPLMGGLADRFGPRRVFLAGMVLVVISGVLGPFARNFGVLLAARVVQALGTSTAFPSAVALIRSLSATRGGDVQSGLSTIAVANSLGAAFGPIVGGLAVAFGGWQALFWLNIPFALLAMVAVWFAVPPDPKTVGISARKALVDSDPVGIILFAVTVLALLLFVLSLPTSPYWWLIPILAVAAAGFLWREITATSPFLNVRMLGRNRPLLAVYGQFLLFNVVYYGAFYGIPQWLEVVRGYSAAQVGLIMLPLAALGAASTPVASALIRRSSTRFVLIAGSALLCLGSAAILSFDADLSVWLVVAILAIMGIPYGLSNLGLQTRMYSAADGSQVSIAAGLFQTSRYLGAILSTSILGVAFASRIGSSELHIMALIMAVLAAVLIVLNLFPTAARVSRNVAS